MSGGAPANQFEGFQFTTGIAPREVTGGQGILGAIEKVLEAALSGLEDAAHLVMDRAKEEVPLLEPESMKRAGRTGGDQGGTPGELRDSGKVDMERDQRRAALSFNTVYASLQHERMDWHHTHGSAKYLERPMTEMRSEVVETIAARIREVTGG